MEPPPKLPTPERVRHLSLFRIIFALAVALIADSVQFVIGPLGWFFVDGAIDVGAMIFTTWALGFHILLLPTFIIEFVPVIGELPTWTGCVIAVIALRKKSHRDQLTASH